MSITDAQKALSTSCAAYVNKIYQIKVTFPDKVPLYAILRLLPNGAFDELFSIANGNNTAEVGVDFALSNRVGYYLCSSPVDMYLTGLGFLYKTAGISFLEKIGAVVINDYAFRFSADGKTGFGTVIFAVFSSGTNPFANDAIPVHTGPLGTLTLEQIRFRPYFGLSSG
jgi:hypothetical protein